MNGNTHKLNAGLNSKKNYLLVTLKSKQTVRTNNNKKNSHTKSNSPKFVNLITDTL